MMQRFVFGIAVKLKAVMCITAAHYGHCMLVLHHGMGRLGLVVL
jgi:hypothetical protein